MMNQGTPNRSSQSAGHSDATVITGPRELQASIHACISGLGGYWKPLAAVARLLEELGELADALERGRGDPQVIEEMADVLFISTCIANQYAADLTAGYAATSGAIEATGEETSFGPVVVEAGEIARVVNAYDGEKPPKAGERLPTVQDAVSRLHLRLHALARPIDGRLFDQVARRIANSSTRDMGRFAPTRDPSLAASLDALRRSGRSDLRLDGADARAWGAPQWDGTVPLPAYAAELLITLSRFAWLAGREGIDGLAITLPRRTPAPDDEARDARSLLEACGVMDLAVIPAKAPLTTDPSLTFNLSGERFIAITLHRLIDGNTPRRPEDHSEVLLLMPASGLGRKDDGSGLSLETRSRVLAMLAHVPG